MKIISNKYIPWKGYKYINLFGILFTRKDSHIILSARDYTHEYIHTLQMKELGYIGFYILYFIEYLFKWIFCLFKDTSKYNFNYQYRSISFEQEAYYNENNPSYLNTRKHYTWLKYIFTYFNLENYTKRHS